MFEKQKLAKLTYDAYQDAVKLDDLVSSNLAANYTEAVDILNRLEAEILIEQIQYLGHESVYGF